MLSKEKRMKRLSSIALAACLFTTGVFAQTQEVELRATKDNTIYSEENLSNGAGQYLFAGVTNQSYKRRALVKFEISGVVPDGVAIDSAFLILTPSLVKTAGTTVSVHSLTLNWGEGDSDAEGEEGKGADASANDATWTKAIVNGDSWIKPGGDYNREASASTVVNLGEKAVFGSAELTANVNTWHQNAADNYGWIVIGDETTNATAIRFISKENDEVISRPRLKMYYQGATSTLPRGFNKDQVSVFLEHNTGNLVIRNNYGSLSVRFELYSITGALVIAGHHYLSGGETSLNTGIENSGIYLYRIISDDGIISGKLIFGAR